MALTVRPMRNRFVNHLVADACWLIATEVVAWWFIPRPWLYVAWGLVFALTVANFIRRWVRERHRVLKSDDGSFCSELGDELRKGYEIRKRARMARGGTDELLNACTSFSEWALRVNDLVLRHEPERYDEPTDARAFVVGW